MAHGIPLRSGFNGDDLRGLARSSSDGKQTRRLLPLSLIYDGGLRCEAARNADVSLQAVRDWVLRFNEKGPDGLVDGKSTGTPPRLNEEQCVALARVWSRKDRPPCLDGVVRRRLCDLAAWLHGEFGVTLDESTVGRALWKMGYRKLRAPPAE